MIYSTKAPFPVDKFYELDSDEGHCFKSPLQQELEFTNKLTQHIPTDYLQKVESTLNAVHDRIRSPRSMDKTIYLCDVFTITVSHKDKRNIVLHLVELRPCAEGCGFYQLILEWLMKITTIIPLPTAMFCIESCLETNSKILDYYGFHAQQNSEWSDSVNYFLTKDECRTFDYTKFRIENKINISSKRYAGTGLKLKLTLDPDRWISAADLNNFYKTQERFYSKINLRQSDNPILKQLMQNFQTNSRDPRLQFNPDLQYMEKNNYLNQQKQKALFSIRQKYGHDYVLDFDNVQTPHFPGLEHINWGDVNYAKLVNFFENIIRQGVVIPSEIMKKYERYKQIKEAIDNDSELEMSDHGSDGYSDDKEYSD